MRNILFAISGIILLAGSFISHAGTTNPPEATAKQDSTLNVIGWFSNHDTLEYWISEGEWRINGTDTVKTAGIATKVRIVVTDSTPSGYKMDYTFLEFRGDTIENSTLNSFQNRLVEKHGSKVVGTTVHFETDEFGEITKITNLGQIKKQAKMLFKESVKELAALPEMQILKQVGFDVKDYTKDINADELVDGYLQELKLLFLCHGRTYDIGSSHEHEDATDTAYENDTYRTVEVDTTDGSYSISAVVESIIPQTELKAMVGGLIEEITDNEDLTESFDKNFDSQVNVDGTVSSYFSSDFLYDGWPYRVIKQTTTMIGDRGKARQTYIYLDAYSLHNHK